MRRVVIVGAGFAGVDCAKELAGRPVDVVIIDRHNFQTFQPLLYQVATAGLAPSDVAYPVRGIFQDAANVRFRQGLVVGVDWESRRVVVEDQPPVDFDYVVVAVGATTRWFDVAGASEHCYPLYGLSDAVRLRNHVLARFEEADQRPDEIERGLLTFTVVGGGSTGVEVAGALTELFGVLERDFAELEVGRARVVLVEMGPSLLAAFSPQAQRHAAAELRARGVVLRLDESVHAVEAGAVVFASGERMATRTVIWAAGVQANPLAAVLGVDQASGRRVVVDATLRIPGRPGAFAVGDVASIPARGDGPLPQLAPVAKQSGRFVGRQIMRELSDRPPASFHYRDRGTMATIGRNAAVADLPGRVHLSGPPAWVAWLVLHLLFLVGFRNRLTVLVNWAWSYLTYDRGSRLIFGEGDDDQR